MASGKYFGPNLVCFLASSVNRFTFHADEDNKGLGFVKFYQSLAEVRTYGYKVTAINIKAT